MTRLKAPALCSACGKTHKSRYRLDLCAAMRKQREAVMLPKPVVVSPVKTREGAAAGRRFAPGWLRQKVLTRDNYLCRYCGRKVTNGNANMDHVTPWPQGMTEENNLVTACRPCNQEKGSKHRLPMPEGRPVSGAH